MRSCNASSKPGTTWPNSSTVRLVISRNFSSLWLTSAYLNPLIDSRLGLVFPQYTINRNKVYGLPLSSLSKEVQEFAGRHSVENIAGTQPALTGDAYTKTHFVQPGNSMCIWINGNLDTFVPGAMQVTPIQIQARGVRVDLDADAVRGGGIDHCLQVQSIAISFKQDAPGGMSNDINVRVGDGPEHTLCLLLRREIELAMN